MQTQRPSRGLRETRAVTSNLVLGKVWTLLSRRIGHFHARSWLDCVHTELALVVERIDPELEEEACTWLRRHDERAYSYVDATSFALMRKLRIREALAFDGASPRPASSSSARRGEA